MGCHLLRCTHSLAKWGVREGPRAELVKTVILSAFFQGSWRGLEKQNRGSHSLCSVLGGNGPKV